MSKNVRRLIEGFAPDHYELTLEPNRDTKRVTGTVTIHGLKKGRPSQRLTFHQHGTKVTKASLVKHDKKGDQVIEVARINHQDTLDEVRLHTEQQLYAGNYTVTMEFESRIQDGMNGIYACNYEVDGQKKQLIATQFESHFARQAFPAIDEPEAKASFQLTLISPAGETALSNMPAAAQEEKDGKLVTTFEATPRMSTYLLAFVFGDMQSKETTTKQGTLVRIWSTKAHRPEALDFAVDAGKRIIEFFNDYYNYPYPLAKADHVALPDFSVGAMENWGLITYRESCLLADPATTSQSGRETVALVMSHELSHQWFGDLVTMKWWNDLWLNESFANVMEYRAPDTLFPEWEVMNTFVAREGLSSIRRDSIAGVQAIKTEVHHPDEISSLFDPSIVYAKGGRLINMLRLYLGEDIFCKGLTAYFTKHANKNTTGDDLWAALSAASGKDVAAFMNPWLEQSGFPVVSVRQQGNELTVSQQHFLLDPTKADKNRRWLVPLLADNPKIPALLDTAEISVQLDNGEYVHVNQGAVGHYIVRYETSEHAEAMAKRAEDKTLNDAERLMLLSDSSMLSRAGRQSYTATLELLKHYNHENSEPVWGVMALILGEVRRFIDLDPALEPPIKTLIRNLVEEQYQRLGWEEKEGESSHDTKLRGTVLGLGIYAEHPQITKEALERFELYKKDPKAVPAQLRSLVLSTAVRDAVPGALDFLLALDEKTADPELKEDIIDAATATRKPEEAERLLNRILGGKVRQNVVDYWLVFLMRNRYTRQTAWDWERKNWGWIEKTFKGDQTYDSFPRYTASAFSTRQLLEEYRAFFEPLCEQPALKLNIGLGIEEITNRAEWLERDLSAVQQFFK
jgi:aminopeptidase N